MKQSIGKLQKKLDKDPNSLIFFQLAEEHRKEGNLEEAQRILKAGLTRHPSYWSARVSLGRIYHQLGNAPSARVELEKVIEAVPDHLLANRLLGDIYTGLHLPGEALKRYRVVRMLTPRDQDVAAQIKRLESEIVEAEPQPTLLPEPQVDVLQETVSDDITASPPQEEQEEEVYAPTIQIQIPDFLEKTEVAAETTEETLQIISPEMSEKEEEVSAAVQVGEPADSLPLEHEPVEAKSEPTLPDTFITEPEFFEHQPEASAEESEVRVLNSVETNRDADELSNLAGLLLTGEGAVEESHEFSELESELEKAPAAFEAEEFRQDRQQDMTQPIGPEEEQSEEADELTSETLAELYLNQGFVDKAVLVYQRLLLNDPGNMNIHQRLEELTSDGATTMQPEAAYKEEPMLLAQETPALSENSAHEDMTARALLRQRKINTLESWLTTIRREQRG